MGFDQFSHAGVAGAARASAQNDRHEVPLAALDRGDKIEARCARIAGLDAVHAFDLAEQAVVVAHRNAAPFEGAGREVAIIFRVAVLDRHREQGLVAGGGDLIVVRQAGGVLVNRAAHAERARLARHRPGEFLFAAGKRLGNHDGGVVRRFCDQRLDGIFDRQRLPGLEAELGRRLFGRVFGRGQFALERQPSGLEPLEQQIERHDFRQRRGMTDAVRIRVPKDVAGIGVDHDFGVAGFV